MWPICRMPFAFFDAAMICSAVGHRARHRLLEEDVLAGLKRGDGGLGVLVPHGHDRHGVDIGIGEQISVVGKGLFDAELLGQFAEPAFRARAERRQLEIGDADDRLAVNFSEPSEPDDANPQPVQALTPSRSFLLPLGEGIVLVVARTSDPVGPEHGDLADPALGEVPPLGNRLRSFPFAACLPGKPAVLQVAHVFEDGVVLPDEHHLEKIADDEGRDDDLLALMCGVDRVTRKATCGLFLTTSGHGRVGLVAQELDRFRMIARIGHPAAALLDPVLVRLRLACGDTDMVEDKHLERTPETSGGRAMRPPLKPD